MSTEAKLRLNPQSRYLKDAEAPSIQRGAAGLSALLGGSDCFSCRGEGERTHLGPFG